ncbi:hypothetical protein LO772_08940 [Yinghuangia sp. ASG 101]|uniref:hypothetical protein n=1 Tax=Yinghuangia sp. ASG 101 TaxID=2896848 RepID=UPI001E34AD79|nr:hypothetical protein [Yinghuangia sp. ASG 101]UGQ13703.1 hypothetical protein LO772_08940 [Yinghuangia sp. ASG 101]
MAGRDIGGLFKLYLFSHPTCTQTRLAQLTLHDRSDVSNWVRGVRSGTVSDIDVLTRIADGLQMPDHARVLLGIAPQDVVIGAVNAAPSTTLPAAVERPLRVALCGSRAAGSEHGVMDRAIRALSRVVLRCELDVVHGPVGVGIEVMTYIADHYRPAAFDRVVGVFGRSNVVRGVDMVIVAGGGPGTQTEVELALAVQRRVVAVPASGGAARAFHELARQNPSVRTWMTEDQFTALDACRDVEDGVRHIEHLLNIVSPGV